MSFYYTIKDIQIQCAAMGFNPGIIDGMNGPNTRKATEQALEKIGSRNVQDLFHHAGLHSVIWHWTAGSKGIIDIERLHYNAVIDNEGNIHDGKYRPEAQATYAVGRAASHTLNANTHRAGVSMDCMAGAVEVPFKWGTNPMTEAHVEGMLEQTAIWCKQFGIIPSKFTTLSHGEVQKTLNIQQKNKWDISILPGMNKPKGSEYVGDMLRERLKDKL